ncbi:MAG TPA: hypothetical protein VGL33_21065 [Streptosporangiaceae bacterium]|jgi:hypothetical protein
MAKIVIGGETFEWDGAKAPMSEALAIEDAYKRRYAEWQADLNAGSAKAICVLAWLIWRRDGRDVLFEDILSGKVDFDLQEMLESMGAAAEAAEAQKAAEADPTVPSDPDGTRTTGTSTSASSRSGSGSGRGKSGSSTSGTSRPS